MQPDDFFGDDDQKGPPPQSPVSSIDEGIELYRAGQNNFVGVNGGLAEPLNLQQLAQEFFNKTRDINTIKRKDILAGILTGIGANQSIASDSFDILSTLKGFLPGMVDLGNAQLEGAARLGRLEDAQSIIIGELLNFVAPDEDKEALKARLINIFDSNNDGSVSRREANDGLGSQKVIDEISKLNATMGRMVKDPDFRTRVIKRAPPGPSLFGPKDSDNQVDTVLQGLANFEQSINEFNVSF